MCLLEVSVAAGEAGSVVTLAGEADLTTVAALREALSAQIDRGARHLMVDLSRLRFADSVALHALAVAGRAIEEAGGKLELLRPQPPVARVLELLGLDQVLTVRGGPGASEEGALPPGGRCAAGLLCYESAGTRHARRMSRLSAGSRPSPAWCGVCARSWRGHGRVNGPAKCR